MVSGNYIVVIVWTVFKQQSLDLVGSPKQARAVLVVLVLLSHIEPVLCR